jgi:hypothetical protein
MTCDSTKEHVASTATSTAMNLNGRSSVIQLINIPGGGGAGKAGQGREKRRGWEGGWRPTADGQFVVVPSTDWRFLTAVEFVTTGTAERFEQGRNLFSTIHARQKVMPCRLT